MPVDLPAPGAALPNSAAASRGGPLELYRERVAAGSIRSDPAQQRAVARLQQLNEALAGYHPPRHNGLLARLGFTAQPEPPRGLYLWGPVGRGKSMLMDLFFAAAPIAQKCRVHFHQFMLDVHNRVEAERRAGTDEPIAKVAADLATAATLLCFDEFQVNDIADAMILERLFRALFDAGSVIVATSNRPPAQLYENGLQRDRFLPFVALLEERLDRVELDSGRDYRLARMLGRPVYYWPLGKAADAALAGAFAELTDDAVPEPQTLEVMKRELLVPKAAGNVAWFSFDELCARPHSAVDFLAIAERYAAVIVEAIPKLGPRQRNEATRLHILIDALYEARTLFIASAEVRPEELYTDGDGAFEFQRTVSRLNEMQSEDYIANRSAL